MPPKAQLHDIVVNFTNELNSIADDDAGTQEKCLCYPTCNQTLFSKEMSHAPFPGPLADKVGITSTVFGTTPTDSHTCYAK